MHVHKIPLPGGAAASAMSWISLILFVGNVASLPSSPFGVPGSVGFNTTIVCSTESGNNTNASCNVSNYNETKLVLSCPGEAGRSACWTRVDGGALNCTGRNCTINSNRRLTNVDSGDYLCTTSVENGTDLRFVRINVLAPPQLHNIAGCFGEEQDKCTLAQNAYIYTHSRYYINVSFDGNGPFQVDWYHNGTKFSCATFKFCEKIEKGSTYQILQLMTYSLRDTMLMSGLYRAVVSNPYGANVSEIRLEYSCKPPAGKVPNTPSKITVNLQEGSMLNESCGVTLQSAQQMYACITKNTSATFADLVNDSDSCAICNSANDLGRACSIQVNSGITNITVNRLEVDGCPPVQLMNFLKGDVTVEEDDGLRIICAYTLASYDQLEPYTSIHVRVSRPPNNHSSQVSVTIPVVCLVVALLVALMTLASCVLLRKRKRKGNHGSVSVHDETAGLLERPGDQGEQAVEPLTGGHDHYGTISIPGDFTDELEPEERGESVEYVTIG